MSRRLPPLNAVRAFEAAGRHASFTKAATELNVTHGAVSRQVAILEEWLGTPLFRRTASQIVLTDAGRSYLAEATAVLDRLAIASMHVVDQVAPTSLTVNAPPTFTMRWLIARMSGFQRKRPDVDIRLTTSIAPVNFRENTYDIAIRGAREPLRDCVSMPFMTEIIVPLCHVDLLEGGQLQHPADLARHTLINYVTEPYPWDEWLASAGVPDLKPAGQLKFEQMFFALQAATEGLGIVLAPLFLAIDDILAGRLCAPFGSLAARSRQYYVCMDHRTPLIESFHTWLMKDGRDTEQSIAAWAESAGWAKFTSID
ncbi:transcriptional regulator [Trinickia symbiotica]|uniref:Transcriptional regulator n=1 Tax=Trinickia symbiotica TaxID=863227 RepID=A0A2T3XLN8_9BURK|nr:transcriptional regulator GcvA [Trinickia symbiotica]PTB17433.1 transcriptional regulator [Trinickia symbiotica]